MTQVINRENTKYLYLQVIDLIREMKNNNVIKVGEKLPSLRKFSKQLSVSIPTVKLAYLEMEKFGWVKAIPKSGYILQPNKNILLPPKRVNASLFPVQVKRQQFIEQMFEAIDSPKYIALGVANPTTLLSPEKVLAKIMRQTLAQMGSKVISYAPMDGYLPLKQQLSRRCLENGLQINPNEIIITNGAQEALSIALKCVAKSGDVIAIESPAYFGVIELIENLDMKALEIPLCPSNGIWIDDLKRSIKQQKIAACIFSTTITNPLGSSMPDEHKEILVELLEKNKIPLIEDDVYGDLYFNDKKGKLAQNYSKERNVLSCGSFSKTIAPGYRIGWLFASKYLSKAKSLKRAMSCSTSLLNQKVLTEYISGNQYDRHLMLLRKKLNFNKNRMVALIESTFPKNTIISNPKGGCVLWIKLSKTDDAKEIFYKALQNNISIIPGNVFSPSDKYKAYIRISYGIPWSDEVERAITVLAKLCKN